MLAGTDHIAYPPETMAYQAGICDLFGGGLYRLGDQACACVEVAGDEVFVKELLCPETERESVLAAIVQAHPAEHYWVRTPYDGLTARIVSFIFSVPPIVITRLV